MRTTTLLALTALLLTCGRQPQPSTTGLHQPCPEAGCAEGQRCLEAAGPGGPTRTCEIDCASDSDCPEPTRCNLPPVVPDSLPNTCQ